MNLRRIDTSIISSLIPVLVVSSLYVFVLWARLSWFSSFLISPLFGALVTLFVGVAAYRVYTKQKEDYKRDAANVLLLEIENAVKKIKVASKTLDSEAPTITENVFLMPEASWGKYRHLFVNDFVPQEWDSISDFYENCSFYDDAVRSYQKIFLHNTGLMREQIQMYLSKEFLQNDPVFNQDASSKVIVEVLSHIKNYVSTNANGPQDFFYVPKKFNLDAKRSLDSVKTNILLTSVGAKLRYLAGLDV